jgi:signal transduction histidine kinase
MSGIGDLSLISGALQLTVPSYSLRLVRRFGTQRVGWFLVAAFSSLAALHLLRRLGPISLGLVRGMPMDVAVAIAATLLLIGLCHLETLLLQRQQATRAEESLRARWEAQVQERTAELLQTNQELLRRIAELEQAQSALRNSELQQKHEVASPFAAGVAHHFNNVLSIISGYASLLSHQSRDERAAEPLSQISAAVKRAAGFSRHLLIASGQFAMRQELVDLDGLMANLDPTLRRFLGKEMALQRSGTPGLPRILADVRLVEHIVVNLVLNAREAMPGGGAITISTAVVPATECQAGEAEGNKRLVRLSVRDTGCGMCPEVEAHLFEPFFSRWGAGKGVGLGLASVLGAVTQQGGRIEYNTQPGVGTEFRVCFPEAPALAAPRASDFRAWDRY